MRPSAENTETFVWTEVLELSPQLHELPVNEEEVQTGGVQQREEATYSGKDVYGAGV